MDTKDQASTATTVAKAAAPEAAVSASLQSVAKAPARIKAKAIAKLEHAGVEYKPGQTVYFDHEDDFIIQRDAKSVERVTD